MSPEMALYYFHSRIGDFLAEDSEGAEMPSVDVARQEAAKILAELVRDELPTTGVLPTVAVDVADLHRRELFSVEMRFAHERQ